MLNSNCSLFIFTLAVLLPYLLFGSFQEISFSMEGKGTVNGYLTLPAKATQYPLILFIQGSEDRSCYEGHKRVAAQFTPHGLGVILLEKEGIYKNNIDMPTFLLNDYYESRKDIYLALLENLEKGFLSDWNGQLIIVGLSEGGKIAPVLANVFPKAVLGTIIIGGGGGIPFAQEMEYQSDQFLKQTNNFTRLMTKVRRSIDSNQFSREITKILAHPDSLEFCGIKTFKWAASYLKHDPLPYLLKIDSPVCLIHGVKDLSIPVYSADKVAEAFQKDEKTNLSYFRYEELDHAIKNQHINTYDTMITWIKEKTKICVSNKE